MPAPGRLDEDLDLLAFGLVGGAQDGGSLREILLGRRGFRLRRGCGNIGGLRSLYGLNGRCGKSAVGVEAELGRGCIYAAGIPLGLGLLTRMPFCTPMMRQ